ncbi:MAG: serine/threonine protein phosphatase [Clostridia bacterium]|nr:serine/threonine protein phosphatase [Clostridia bacterium]
MRSCLIGDIHGCHRELMDLLERMKPDPGKDRLILLGDLFDRGPDSYEVFLEVQRLAEAFGERFVLLRGNHEDYLLREKLSFFEKRMWNRVGRGAAAESFARHGARMEDSRDFLRTHCVLYYREADFQCAHAGVKVEPAEANDMQTLVHDHDIVPENGYAGMLTVTGHIALEKPTWFAGDRERTEELPYGETLPLPEKGVICIDTGCGKGGRLTGMIAEDRRFTLACSGGQGSAE